MKAEPFVRINIKEAQQLLDGKMLIDAMVILKQILDVAPNHKKAWAMFRSTQKTLKDHFFEPSFLNTFEQMFVFCW